MFINELRLYVNYFKDLLDDSSHILDKKRVKFITDFYNQLHNGMNYYKSLSERMKNFSKKDIDKFLHDIDKHVAELSDVYQKFQLEKTNSVCNA